jgi:hypothetical protein
MARQVRQTLPDAPPEYDQAYIAALARSLNSYMNQAQALGEVVAARFIMTDPVHVPGDIPHIKGQPTTAGLPVGTLYLTTVSGVPVLTVVMKGDA